MTTTKIIESACGHVQAPGGSNSLALLGGLSAGRLAQNYAKFQNFFCFERGRGSGHERSSNGQICKNN